MDKFISLFYNSLLLADTKSTILFGLGSCSMLGGSSLLDSATMGPFETERKRAWLTAALGIGLSTVGTSVSLASSNGLEKIRDELQLTQAYVESLDESQLSDLIVQLEEKDIELCGEKPKTKIKTL